MKRKSLLLFIAMFFLGLAPSMSQITCVPSEPTDLDAVVITLNTAGTGLQGYTGNVYAHTGVTIAGVGAWQYVIGSWGNNATQPMLTNISPGIYQLTISPSIRAFYGVPDNQDIIAMCFVFRSENGSQQTIDLFWQVYGVPIPDPVPVTFNVDLSYAFGFNPATDDIYITGSMVSWAMPGTNPNMEMQPVTGNPMMYTLTLTLDPGYYDYKYFRVIDNTPSWDFGEWPGDPNRNVHVQDTMIVNDVWGFLIPPLFGDANCDGLVNILDIVVINAFIMGENPEPFCFHNADVNYDGEINLLDIVGTVNIILGGE